MKTHTLNIKSTFYLLSILLLFSVIRCKCLNNNNNNSNKNKQIVWWAKKKHKCVWDFLIVIETMFKLHIQCQALIVKWQSAIGMSPMTAYRKGSSFTKSFFHSKKKKSVIQLNSWRYYFPPKKKLTNKQTRTKKPFKCTCLFVECTKRIDTPNDSAFSMLVSLIDRKNTHSKLIKTGCSYNYFFSRSSCIQIWFDLFCFLFDKVLSHLTATFNFSVAFSFRSTAMWFSGMAL